MEATSKSSAELFSTQDFNFDLPSELIAQQPSAVRDQSRLLVLERASGSLSHLRFDAIPTFPHQGDVVVMNNTKVIPARLRGKKADSSGNIEILLLEELALNEWKVLLRPGKRVRPGTEINLLDLQHQPSGVLAHVEEKQEDGQCRLTFRGTANLLTELDRLGETPLPPYIARNAASPITPEDAQRYQTVYAEHSGSVAAPTAGLHWSRGLLDELRQRGVSLQHVTLHVGLGTFAPVKAEKLSEHVMHEERFDLPQSTVDAIQRAKESGKRVFAVGTTTLRALESAAAQEGGLKAMSGRTRIFIYPPYQFRVVDALVTNFHLPCSTLLMLVSAFASPGKTGGREKILAAYAEAIRQKYRFFSYGDAMLLL